MDIVITNVYCYLNKGDAGIVIAMLENIKKIAPDSNVKIISLYPDIDLGKYDPDVEVIPSPMLVDRKHTGIRKFLGNLRCFLRLKKDLKSGVLNAAESAIKNSDIVISCGGGYMQSFNLKYFYSDFIYHYSQLYVANFFKRPYYIFAQTVGPFSKLCQHLASPIINGANAVLAREEVSYDYVNKHFNNSNVMLTSDVAFLLEPKEVKFPIDKNKKNVGITLREWSFPNQPNASKLMKKYEDSVIEFIDWLANKGYTVYLMPQCIGPGPDNDLIISNRVYSKVNKGNVILVDEDLTPGQLKFLYGQMDYFVGTRMHSNIFALGEEVPCLAISYDPKTDGIMALFGLSDYVVDINSIDYEKLVDTFEKILVNEGEVKEKISLKLTDIKQDAIENFKKVLGNEKN